VTLFFFFCGVVTQTGSWLHWIPFPLLFRHDSTRQISPGKKRRRQEAVFHRLSRDLGHTRRRAALHHPQETQRKEAEEAERWELKGWREKLNESLMRHSERIWNEEIFFLKIDLYVWNISCFMFSALSRCQKPGRDADQVRPLFPNVAQNLTEILFSLTQKVVKMKSTFLKKIWSHDLCVCVCVCVCVLVVYLWISKNNRSFDTPVKGPPQGPRLHIDIPRVQLLIEDKEGIKQIGERKRKRHR